MKNKHLKTWFFYGALLVLFIVFTYLLFQRAGRFETNPSLDLSNGVTVSPVEMFFDSLRHNLAEPAALLLLQIAAILLVARLFGFLFAKMGQPTVIGEILAGIVLGPSLLGQISPVAFNFLFAPESLDSLYILSQIGLVLFMFIIGLELDLSSLKSKMSETFVISQASILIPFFCGMVLAYFIYQEFAAAQTAFLPFALFIGISMSITAFPVLARIVQEKGLTRTHLGTVSLASAAIGDVTAWCMLAAIIAIAKSGSFISSLYTIGFAILYVLVMFFVIRPFLSRIGKIYSNTEVMNKSIFAFFVLILILSAFITQYIGIHALFGAFLAGVIMPPFPQFRKMLIERIEDISVTLFLPLFFVYTGLNTEIGLLNTPHLWAICGVIILVAIFGKFVGSAVPAYIVGESKKDSLSIGVLMNTRGLMELIVLNIGFEMGILPPAIFVMLVIMALVTTFMTTPAMSLIERLYSHKTVQQEYQQTKALGIFRVLVAMGNPVNGKPMLRVAKSVLDGVKKSLDVTALHLTPGTDTNPIHGEQFADESFEFINEEAEKLNIPIHPLHKVTDNIQGEIVRTANYYKYDFLLVGANIAVSEDKKRFHIPNVKWLNRIVYRFQKRAIFYPGSLIKDKTSYFIENSNCSVGILLNKNFQTVHNTVLFLYDENDIFLFRYARYLLKNDTDVSITVVDINKVLADKGLSVQYDELKKQYGSRISKQNKHIAGLFSTFSFMLMGYKTWDFLSEVKSEILSEMPSALIINKKSSEDRIASSENTIDTGIS